MSTATANPTQPSTRDRIIAAAVELFWEKGYEATSMAELLAKSKANSGSFYYFFKSKDDLLRAVLEWYLGALETELVGPIFAAESDPIRRIFALLAKYRELIVMTGCTYGCPIGRLALEISPANNEAHRLLALNFDGWTQAIERCLEEAADRFPESVDRRKLSRFVLTVMEGGVMQSRSQRSVEPFDDSVEVLRDYFDRLAADRATPKPQKARRTMRARTRKVKR